ncbi:MAG: YggS family pyridoxal phosphate-dependent enzyme [Flavipsychrobacter sp.]|nr:YggS family pyridoxal phosphate-dependent enzyme [Flavipsychrobacter sp.]
MVHTEVWKQLHEELADKGVTLVAVSKTKPATDIQEMYDLGQRDFGENYVQELVDKETMLPKDIRWHHIGHLQSNKVKYIAPFVHLIHAVDSAKLLAEINKQAEKNARVIDVLLQLHIADEETKFGMDEQEISSLLAEAQTLAHVRICGLMGMATNTDDEQQIREEYRRLVALFQSLAAEQGAPFSICSIGMSGDYRIAVQEGSNMVRIGSLLFGERSYPR